MLRAVNIDPQSAEAQSLLGYTVGNLNRIAEAMDRVTNALTLQPALWPALVYLTTILIARGKVVEAVGWLEKAIAADPNLAPAHQALGDLYDSLGRHEEALAELERAVALEPGSGYFHLALSNVKTYTQGDAHLSQMQALRHAEMPPMEKAQLLFALAKANMDIGHHDRAFPLLYTGNKIARQKFSYDEKHVFSVFEQTKKVFTPQLFRSRAGFGHPSERPIFIVGMPRSGSTLLEQILASHPDVHGAGEIKVFSKACGPLVRQFPSDVIRLAPEKLRDIGEAYLKLIAEENAAAPRVVDKLLSNFLFVGQIYLALPNARVIHAMRDPIDTCLSCYATFFTKELPYTFDLGELGRYYRAYRGLMDHWRAALPAGALLEVQYEKVVEDVEGEARRLVEFCGLDWNPACAEFFNSKRQVLTPSVAQVRRPIYKSSVGKKRPDDAMLAPLLAGLGEN